MEAQKALGMKPSPERVYASVGRSDHNQKVFRFKRFSLRILLYPSLRR